MALSLGLAGALIGCGERRSGGGGDEGSGAEGGDLTIERLSVELLALDREGERIDLDVDLDKLVREGATKAQALRIAKAGAKSSGRGARLRFKARLIPDGSSGQLHGLISARIIRTGTIPISAEIDAVHEGGPSAKTLPPEVYVEHLKKAIGEAIVALDQQAKLLGSGNKALVKALDHEEPDVRIAAARSLGERRARDGVEPLCDLLKRERGPVGQAAIGALAVIGDTRGVPCLIQWAGAEDKRLVMVLEPIASIGGEEATEFLEMIASGHENTDVRRLAEVGLKRIVEDAKNRNR